MAYFQDIEAVLFDMDGTLIKHTWQTNQITKALFAKFSAALNPITYERFYEVFWDKNADLWYMMVDGKIDGETAQAYSYVNTLRALDQNIDLALEMVAYWSELVLKEAIPFADTYEVLQTIRPHFTTGIVTNGFTTLQRAKIDHYHLDTFVDFCLVSEEAGFHKPDVHLFECALAQAGNVLPARTVFVGDKLEADIEGAHQAGLNPVFMNPSDDQAPPANVPKIYCLTELLDLLPFP